MVISAVLEIARLRVLAILAILAILASLGKLGTCGNPGNTRKFCNPRYFGILRALQSWQHGRSNFGVSLGNLDNLGNFGISGISAVLASAHLAALLALLALLSNSAISAFSANSAISEIFSAISAISTILAFRANRQFHFGNPVNLGSFCNLLAILAPGVLVTFGNVGRKRNNGVLGYIGKILVISAILDINLGSFCNLGKISSFGNPGSAILAFLSHLATSAESAITACFGNPGNTVTFGKFCNSGTICSFCSPGILGNFCNVSTKRRPCIFGCLCNRGNTGDGNGLESSLAIPSDRQWQFWQSRRTLKVLAI